MPVIPEMAGGVIEWWFMPGWAKNKTLSVK
jgi:hypothetical protein